MFTKELKFSDLSKLLEAVSTSRIPKKRIDYVGEYFKKLHKFRVEFKKNNKDLDSSCLAVMRIILSQEERERTYGLQEKSLRQLYIKALKLDNKSADAVKITQCSEEELPTKIFEVMKLRTSETGSLTIYDVDQSLSFLSNNQKQSQQENELRRVILQSNALDQKWFCKMILKTMNLQIGTTKILQLFHPKAHQLFLKYNHLSRVVELIESGQADAAMVELTEVYVPIRSMLCQKFTPDLNKDFLNKEIFQETKMDGERFQLHMKNGQFRYYSRNGHEFSEGFNNLLSPLIQFSTIVHSVILDGEMLVYDKNERRYFTKGETPIDVKHMKDQSSNFRPCFCAFDVLLYNDQNFMNRPYSERNQLLGQLFKDREGVFVKTIPIKIRSIEHMVELFNIAIEKNEEGIVLKDSQSIYSPGDRAGGWYKVKPDYFDGEVVKDFDCVIIGGYYENHFTKNFIQRYMVGAVEKVNDETINAYSIGEVVHGVAVQERMKIFQSLKPHLIEHSGESQVSFNGGKIFFGRNKPHAWIPPNLSIVLECRASELVKTNEQYTDYTFRFPRINNVRRDKVWDECSTLKEFLKMCDETTADGRVKKIVTRYINKADITSPSRKRKAAQSKSSLIEKFCQNSQEHDDLVIDNVLEGKEFCVLTTNPKLPSIKEMKLMVRQHGGTTTEFPRKGKTFAIIAGLLTKMVKSYMNQKLYNVIKADWLVDNFGTEKGNVLKEIPKIRPVIDLYYATETMKESLKKFYDHHGDSYTEKFESVDQLKAFLENMSETSCEKYDLIELDEEMKKHGAIDINFFRNLSAVFLTLHDDHFVFEIAKNVLKFRAGSVIDLKDVKYEETTHVIIDKNENVQEIQKILSENSIIEFKLIDYHWILESSDSGKALPEGNFLVSVE